MEASLVATWAVAGVLPPLSSMPESFVPVPVVTDMTLSPSASPSHVGELLSSDACSIGPVA